MEEKEHRNKKVHYQNFRKVKIQQKNDLWLRDSLREEARF